MPNVYYVVARRHKDTKEVQDLQSFFDTERDASDDAKLWNDEEEDEFSDYEYAIYKLSQYQQ